MMLLYRRVKYQSFSFTRMQVIIKRDYVKWSPPTPEKYLKWSTNNNYVTHYYRNKI